MSRNTICIRGLPLKRGNPSSYRSVKMDNYICSMVTGQASINLRNILEVWEKEQLVSLETTLRLYWKVTHPETKSCNKFAKSVSDAYIIGHILNGKLFKSSFVQDTRLRPDAKYLESSDSFGEYVALNPSKADIIWMPDVFIDQVHCLFCCITETDANHPNNEIVKINS